MGVSPFTCTTLSAINIISCNTTQRTHTVLVVLSLNSSSRQNKLFRLGHPRRRHPFSNKNLIVHLLASSFLPHTKCLRVFLFLPEDNISKSCITAAMASKLILVLRLCRMPSPLKTGREFGIQKSRTYIDGRLEQWEEEEEGHPMSKWWPIRSALES